MIVCIYIFKNPMMHRKIIKKLGGSCCACCARSLCFWNYSTQTLSQPAGSCELQVCFALFESTGYDTISGKMSGIYLA